ncbi:MAG: CoA-binding protein, partial [Bacteroidota bacterium]
MKKTLIIGASPNSDRYAYKAAHRLIEKGHEIVNIGIKNGEVAGVKIEKPGTPYQDIDTITLYIGQDLQAGYYDYILQTKPNRVIFNPGAENEELEGLLAQHDIEYTEACTLV